MRKHTIVHRALAIAVASLITTANVPVSVQDPYVAPDLLKTEVQDIVTAGQALVRFEDHAAALEQKKPLSQADLEGLQTEADLFKRTLPAYQRALSSSTAKLKSAGKWTPQLDTFVEQKLRENRIDDRIILQLKSAGGYRALLDRAAASMTQLGSEVDKRIAELRGTAAIQQIIDFFLGTPVSARVSRGRCVVVLAGIASSFIFGPVAPIAIGYLSSAYNRHCGNAF
jgi:hypothetical protein